MSTPSTAAVLPPPYPHYSSHRNHLLGSHPHLTNGHSYSAPSSSSGTITNGLHSHHLSHHLSLPSSSTMGSRVVQAPQANGGRPRKQPVDWNEFYKNGIPQEIIVIDDTESPPPPPNAKRTTLTTSRIAPASQSAMNNIPRHADKKRRTTNTSNYEPVYPGPVYSATHTPLAVGHASPTVTASTSTAGRNSSTLISTAATSAGSTGVGIPATVAYPAGNGTKRKRMATRSTVAAAVAAASGDVFGGYHPPPKPPIKAKEVYVKPVADVRTQFLEFSIRTYMRLTALSLV